MLNRNMLLGINRKQLITDVYDFQNNGQLWWNINWLGIYWYESGQWFYQYSQGGMYWCYIIPPESIFRWILKKIKINGKIDTNKSSIYLFTQVNTQANLCRYRGDNWTNTIKIYNASIQSIWEQTIGNYTWELEMIAEIIDDNTIIFSVNSVSITCTLSEIGKVYKDLRIQKNIARWIDSRWDSNKKYFRKIEITTEN
jgi:hypothetical protein